MRHSKTVFAGAIAGLMLMAAPATALTVEVQSSEAFQEKLDDDLGVREAEHLADSVTKELEKAFTKKGIEAERVIVTIEDARPNRPTFKQLGDRIGLDPIRSFGTGGAKLSAIAYDATGAEIGQLEYKWYQNDITQSANLTTWHDARWAFDRFARRFANSLS